MDCSQSRTLRQEKKLLKLRVYDSLPSIINADVGAIINSLRSALDLLAVSVAKSEMVLRYNDVYFPIARNADAFSSGEL